MNAGIGSFSFPESDSHQEALTELKQPKSVRSGDLIRNRLSPLSVELVPPLHWRWDIEHTGRTASRYRR
jgi:hypothetical protein